MRAPPADSPATLRDAAKVFVQHGSPRALLAAVGVCAMARVAVGDWSVWDLAPVAIILALWPLQEWLIHVLVLHARPRKIGPWTVDSLYARKHRTHHREPWNVPILFIPLRTYWVNLPLLALFYWAVTPTVGLGLTALTVHLAGALHYECVHFLVHTRVTPRTAYYAQLWRNHRLHHFKNEHYWYGVTRLEADWLLGTAPVATQVEASPTARTLGEPAVS